MRSLGKPMARLVRTSSADDTPLRIATTRLIGSISKAAAKWLRLPVRPVVRGVDGRARFAMIFGLSMDMNVPNETFCRPIKASSLWVVKERAGFGMGCGTPPAPGETSGLRRNRRARKVACFVAGTQGMAGGIAADTAGPQRKTSLPGPRMNRPDRVASHKPPAPGREDALSTLARGYILGMPHAFQ